MQPATLRQTDSMTRPQEAGVGPQQFWRKDSAEHRIRRTIQIRQQTVQEPRALNQSFADAVPVSTGNQQGNKIQVPGPVEAVRIAVDVMGHAIRVNQATSQIAPVAEFAGL